MEALPARQQSHSTDQARGQDSAASWRSRPLGGKNPEAVGMPSPSGKLAALREQIEMVTLKRDDTMDPAERERLNQTLNELLNDLANFPAEEGSGTGALYIYK